MKNLRITVNGTAYDVQVEELAPGTAPAPALKAAAAVQAPAPAPAVAAEQPKPAAPTGSTGSESVECPMPGTIVSINVTVGQQVKKGDILVILEAMKMENEIMAANDATVASINVTKGESVETGTVLLTLN